jgi:hypothetical protein
MYAVLWWVSWIGIGWYMWLHTFPNTMDWLGYAQPYDALGWHTDSPPPSLYLTQGDIGAIRNQAMFHGPLGLAFYLLALWPLFVALTRRKYAEIKAIKHTREDILFIVLPVLVYILLLRSSISRAAIGAWVIVTICMGLRAIKSYRWKYRMYIVGLGIL